MLFCCKRAAVAVYNPLQGIFVPKFFMSFLSQLCFKQLKTYCLRDNFLKGNNPFFETPFFDKKCYPIVNECNS